MDVEGILVFAERVLPSAANLWVHSSLAQKQRLQQVFFPEGVRFDGKTLVGTGTTLPVFNYLSPASEEKKELVDQTGVVPARGAEGFAARPDERMARHRPNEVTEMVDQNIASWNHLHVWLRQLDALRLVA